MPGSRRERASPVVRCPACGGDSLYAPANPHRPFCSERCRSIDLGAWATESYRVAAAPSGDESGTVGDDALRSEDGPPAS